MIKRWSVLLALPFEFAEVASDSNDLVSDYGTPFLPIDDGSLCTTCFTLGCHTALVDAAVTELNEHKKELQQEIDDLTLKNTALEMMVKDMPAQIDAIQKNLDASESKYAQLAASHEAEKKKWEAKCTESSEKLNAKVAALEAQLSKMQIRCASHTAPGIPRRNDKFSRFLSVYRADNVRFPGGSRWDRYTRRSHGR